MRKGWKGPNKALRGLRQEGKSTFRVDPSGVGADGGHPSVRGQASVLEIRAAHPTSEAR